MIILDTNILLELIRPRPASEVVHWLKHGIDNKTLATTVITLYEIEYGIRRLPSGVRRHELEERFVKLTGPQSEFSILSFDENAARLAGEFRARRETRGLHAQSADMIIAAITAFTESTLATRNVKDFTDIGIKVINPWDRIN